MPPTARSPTPPPISPLLPTLPPPHLSPNQLLLPTSTLYAAPPDPLLQHYGPYHAERRMLDWGYHKIPTRERQAMQDEIVRDVLRRVARECLANDGKSCEGGGEGKPLALFTAGGMGAGKGHTLRHYLSDGTIVLPSNFVWVDPDALARLLPERPQYLASNPKTASTLLHPEASMLQEILSNVARAQRRSLVVDGSLTDCGWFGGLMREYEDDGYDIEILFVFAGEAKMLERAERRALETGRVTNPKNIKTSRLRSPDCVARLARKQHVGRVRLVDNSSDTIPPTIVYDSAKDPDWLGEDYEVDVVGFVEGGRRQREDGRVVEVPPPPASSSGYSTPLFETTSTPPEGVGRTVGVGEEGRARAIL